MKTFCLATASLVTVRTTQKQRQKLIMTRGKFLNGDKIMWYFGIADKINSICGKHNCSIPRTLPLLAHGISNVEERNNVLT